MTMDSKLFFIVFVFSQCFTNNCFGQQFKRQNFWSWGLVDPESKTEDKAGKLLDKTTTTTESPINDPCAPYNPPLPNFHKEGRRISEVKCYEYIWEMKKRYDVYNNVISCALAQAAAASAAGSGLYASVGGRDTLPGEFPHMGAIGWKAAVGTWLFKCGGSLVSPKFVLTAAHCTKASPLDTSLADPVPKIVRLGDKNISDRRSKGVYPHNASIKRIIIHPGFHSPTRYNDIALLELGKEVIFTDLIQPACLWSAYDTSNLGTKATLTGWGVIEAGTLKTSPELQAAEVDIINNELCNQLLKSSCNRHWCGVKDQICGGVLAGGIDACHGDSGGPLQVKIKLPPYKIDFPSSIHYVTGIIQFGIGCGKKNTPGVYTRVSSYIDWIESNVWG